MNHIKYLIGFIALVLIQSTSFGQAGADTTVCAINGDKIIFRFQKNWDTDKRAAICAQYNIDSLAMETVLGEELVSKIDFNDESWFVEYPNETTVVLFKDVSTMKGKWNGTTDILISPNGSGKFKAGPGYVNQSHVKFGVNSLKDKVIIQYVDGRTTFILQKHVKATKVILAGTFNDWNETELSMEQNGNQWEITVQLLPGKYLYKYIVDGEWISDPNNHKKEPDGHKGHNSVMYRYNHSFDLDGNETAKRIYLSGSFNNWKEKELQLVKTNTGWSLPVYLNNGTYAYKFIVDGIWTLDPSNAISSENGMGEKNSIIGIGRTTNFSLDGFPDAEEVILTGDFNVWNESELALQKTTTGWQISYAVAPGNYEYKYLVDGEWIIDPNNPYHVHHGDYHNSFIAIQPNHHFELANHTEENSIIVTGSFNNWDEGKYQMVFSNGKWEFPIYLAPGKHYYKFIIDEDWIIDEANPLYEHNFYGTDNSILWIK